MLSRVVATSGRVGAGLVEKIVRRKVLSSLATPSLDLASRALESHKKPFEALLKKPLHPVVATSIHPSDMDHKALQDAKVAEQFKQKDIETACLYYQTAMSRILKDVIKEEHLEKYINSIELLQKIMAIEFSMDRVYSAVSGQIDTLTIEDKEAIKRNTPLDLAFTAHPTQPLNLKAIKLRDQIIEVFRIMSDVEKERKISDRNLVRLEDCAVDIGITKEFTALDFDQFDLEAKAILKEITREFVLSPINVEKKLTTQDERDLLLYNMARFKKYWIELVTRHSNLLKISDATIHSWIADMDGKPHIAPGVGLIFQYQSQQIFFRTLVKQLDSFYRTAFKETRGGGARLEATEELVRKISEIIATAPINEDGQPKLLAGEEARKVEQQIIKLIEDYQVENEIRSDQLEEIKNHIISSECKISETGFITREEVDKTDDAFDEILEFLEQQEDYNPLNPMPLVARFFAESSTDPKKQKSLDNAKKILMIFMESASMNKDHEHIISQCNNNVESVQKIIQLFQIAQELPRYYEEIPYFQEYYQAKSKEFGFDCCEALFSKEAVKRAMLAKIVPSPLAETEDTIIELPKFYEKLLSDEFYTSYRGLPKHDESESMTREEYLKMFGKKESSKPDEKRINGRSDASRELSVVRASFYNLVASLKAKRMAETFGYIVSNRIGAGLDDFDRLGEILSGMGGGAVTIQGSDADNQLSGRTLEKLRMRELTAAQDLKNFEESCSSEEKEKIFNHFKKLHHASEKGLKITLDGKETYVGYAVHRPVATHPGAVAMGLYSARPASRDGDKSKIKSAPRYGFDALGESAADLNKRQIGFVNDQRTSGGQTFTCNGFFKEIDGVPLDALIKFFKIDSIANCCFAALYANATCDAENYFLVNGFDKDAIITKDAMEESAKLYEEATNIADKEGEDAAREFAENNFITAEHKAELKKLESDGGRSFRESMDEIIKAFHINWQVKGHSRVLRNATKLLIADCTDETKAEVERLCTEAESGDPYQRYGDLVTRACKTIAADPHFAKPENRFNKLRFECIANQSRIANEKVIGFVDLRKKMTKAAYLGIVAGDVERFEEASKWLGPISRDIGQNANPAAVGAESSVARSKITEGEVNGLTKSVLGAFRETEAEALELLKGMPRRADKPSESSVATDKKSPAVKVTLPAGSEPQALPLVGVASRAA